MNGFLYSMFEMKAASQKAASHRSKTGNVSYARASVHENETWFDKMMGKTKEMREKVSQARSNIRPKMRQKVEHFASEKLGIPQYKLHLPTKLKKNTKAVAEGTKSMAGWWGVAELKALVSYAASNIFGQLDIWGKEFTKAIWGGINSLPMSSGKSHTGEKMLDALLASQASKANAFRF